MGKKSVGLLLILGALAVLMWLFANSRSNPCMKIIAHLPNGSQGWTVCWADGLVCVGNDNNQYVLIANNGKTVKRLKISCDGLPLSVQCRRRLIFSEVHSVDNKDLRSYLAILDLHTGNCERFLPCDEAFWLYPLYYYRGQFWSPSIDRMIAMSFTKRHTSNTLMVINRHSRSKEEWVAPKGRIRSWAWPEDDSGYPWVLTVAPGMLYHVEAPSEVPVSVPALDNASSAMLSPALDGAIGFQASLNLHEPNSVTVFYVDFRHPKRRQIVALEDGSAAQSLVTQWAIWSPDGRNVALVLNAPGSTIPRLYVGDPAKRLRLISTAGFRFPSDSDAPTQLTGLTLAWSEDSHSLFGVLIRSSNDSGLGGRTYAIGRYALR